MSESENSQNVPEAPQQSQHGMWSNRWLFILAAAGSAVGLGNIWKFPYITGENGGGSFVLIYLLCIAAIGVPIMIGEVALGKLGRASPINSMYALAQRFNANASWSVIGWLGVFTGFVILSFYAVVGGWILHYVMLAISGAFAGLDTTGADVIWNDFVASPAMVVLWFTVFMAVTVAIVARGVTRGLEVAIRWLMPLLLVLLLILVGYGFFTGSMGESFRYLFTFRLEDLSGAAFIVAMGHAFFTLSVGMGAIMAYGAYVPQEVSIKSTVITISVLDTLVALLAGLAIFAIVFAHDMDPAQSVGLLFISVPVAFGALPLGSIFGLLFFSLVTFAAITSAISILEPAIAYFVERFNTNRWRVACVIGLIAWLLGLLSCFSFNLMSDVTIADMTFFGIFDSGTQYLLLPLGGILIALFVGWVIPENTLRSSIGLVATWQVQLWRWVVGAVAPLGVLFVIVYELLLSG